MSWGWGGDEVRCGEWGWGGGEVGGGNEVGYGGRWVGGEWTEGDVDTRICKRVWG